MFGLAVSLLLLVASPEPELTLNLQPGATLLAAWLGPAGNSGADEFQGTVSCFGSGASLPVSGRAERDGDVLRIAVALRYADVSPDWVSRWRPGERCSIRGRLAGGGSIDWSAAPILALSPPAAESDRALISLTSLELIRLSDKAADVRAVVTAVNPFAFPLEVAAADGGILVRGEGVGTGRAKGRTLGPRKKGRFKIELRTDPQRFRSAAGDRWDVGGELDAEVDAGLTVRLPGGAQTLRMRLPGKMGTDGARSGPYSLPDGATSLVPR